MNTGWVVDPNTEVFAVNRLAGRPTNTTRLKFDRLLVLPVERTIKAGGRLFEDDHVRTSSICKGNFHGFSGILNRHLSICFRFVPWTGWSALNESQNLFPVGWIWPGLQHDFRLSRWLPVGVIRVQADQAPPSAEEVSCFIQWDFNYKQSSGPSASYMTCGCTA